MRGLVVEDTWERVKNYQQETVHDFLELFAGAGCTDLSQLNRGFIHKKVVDDIKSYEELYPTVETGVLLKTPHSQTTIKSKLKFGFLFFRKYKKAASICWKLLLLLLRLSTTTARLTFKILIQSKKYSSYLTYLNWTSSKYICYR